jgi:hypothetical protein
MRFRIRMLGSPGAMRFSYRPHGASTQRAPGLSTTAPALQACQIFAWATGSDTQGALIFGFAPETRPPSSAFRYGINPFHASDLIYLMKQILTIYNLNLD